MRFPGRLYPAHCFCLLFGGSAFEACSRVQESGVVWRLEWKGRTVNRTAKVTCRKDLAMESHKKRCVSNSTTDFELCNG